MMRLRLMAKLNLTSLLVGSIAFIMLTSFTADSLPKTFTDFLSRADMVFENPEGLVATPVIQNNQMSYEYAVKYPDKNFEVRYAVRPSDDLWKAYNLVPKPLKKGDINTNPDSTYMSALESVILNVSGGQLPKITDFEKAAVKSEFSADWGGTVFVHPGREFGQAYKYCMIVALHKSHAGDAYIFYLSDSQEKFNELVAPAFHSLRFNNL